MLKEIFGIDNNNKKLKVYYDNEKDYFVMVIFGEREKIGMKIKSEDFLRLKRVVESYEKYLVEEGVKVFKNENRKDINK